MGRGEPGDEKERELKAPECAIAAGRWEGRQTRSSVRFNEERNKQHENRPIYTKLTNICTTSSPADSLRASSPIWASETSLARTRVLVRLASLVQIGELARGLPR